MLCVGGGLALNVKCVLFKFDISNLSLIFIIITENFFNRYITFLHLVMAFFMNKFIHALVYSLTNLSSLNHSAFL